MHFYCIHAHCISRIQQRGEIVKLLIMYVPYPPPPSLMGGAEKCRKFYIPGTGRAHACFVKRRCREHNPSW
jgi:hypothetical protein